MWEQKGHKWVRVGCEKGISWKQRAPINTKRLIKKDKYRKVKGTRGTKKDTFLRGKSRYAEEKAYVWTKRAHVGTKRGEVGYLGKGNILVWNEIVTVKTLNITWYDLNTKMGIFQKRYLGKRAHLCIWTKLGAAATLAPPPRRPRPCFITHPDSVFAHSRKDRNKFECTSEFWLDLADVDVF